MNIPPSETHSPMALLDPGRSPEILQFQITPTGSAVRILAIDNDRGILDSLKYGLGEFGFEVEREESGKRAIARLQDEHYDAVLLDLKLGTVSGLEILRAIRARNQSTAIIILSGVRDHQVAVLAIQEGADDYVGKPFRLEQLRERIDQAVVRRNKFAARLREERELTEVVRKSNDEILQREAELESLAIRSIRSLVLSLEAKDPYTKDHSIKVALLSVRIAKQIGMSEQEQREVRLAGLLHDVGKIGVRESVLHKPGKLDDEELDHMRLHPQIGARILLPLSHRFPQVVDAVRSEHERWDGRGYPEGISGAQIPIAARIIAVADCHDAITSNRPYRKAQLKELAAREIAGGSGTQFDPDVVQAFLELIPAL
ncbi:MAG: HD domain-containing phosphohydrolase [Planctomycetota bacterium]